MFENLIPVSTWDEPNLAVYTKLTEAQLFHYQPQHPACLSPKVRR